MKILRRSIMPIAALLLLAAAVSGCVPSALSPEAAAVQAASSGHMADFTIDSQSVQVTQSATIGDTVVVQVKFSGVRPSSGRENCLGIFEVVKGRFGFWNAQGSGIGCAAGRPPVEEMPFTVGMTTFGGRKPTELGYSIASGEVFDDRITSIRLTWPDGVSDEAPVMNQTFMSVRQGEVQAVNFDGLDTDGNVVSSSSIGIAPGKR